jgi:hypothetical protein
VIRQPRPAAPLLERTDVDAILAWMFDIRVEVRAIRTILEEDDGEEDPQADA